MDMFDLGIAIKRARLSKQMTQEELCVAVGLARPTLSRLENGRMPEIGIRKVMDLCGRLGLEITLQEAHGRPTLQQLQAQNKIGYEIDSLTGSRQRVRHVKPKLSVPESEN
jgi:HTH-type transcriptional regulator/antitoxin HipB